MARPRSPRSLAGDGEVAAGGQGLLDMPGHAFGPDLAMVAGEHSWAARRGGSWCCFRAAVSMGVRHGGTGWRWDCLPNGSAGRSVQGAWRQRPRAGERTVGEASPGWDRSGARKQEEEAAAEAGLLARARTGDLDAFVQLI